MSRRLGRAVSWSTVFTGWWERTVGSRLAWGPRCLPDSQLGVASLDHPTQGVPWAVPLTLWAGLGGVRSASAVYPTGG